MGIGHAHSPQAPSLSAVAGVFERVLLLERARPGAELSAAI